MAENDAKPTVGAKDDTKAAAKAVAETNAKALEVSEQRRAVIHADNVEADAVLSIEEAHEVGYFGRKVDPEPNESYTLEGVTKESK